MDQQPKQPPPPTSTERASFTTSQKRDSGYASLLSLPFPLTPRASNATMNVGNDLTDVNFFDKPVPARLQNTFSDFRLLYSRQLWETLSKKSGNPESTGIKLRYMGKTEQDAELCIVIYCEKEIAKRARRFFVQNQVREYLGTDFKIRIITAPLIQLAGPVGQIKVYKGPSVPSETLCGTSIQVRGNISSAFATLGGLLEISKEGKTMIYGLTAGHSLRTVYHNQPESPKSMENGDFHDDDDDDDESGCDLAEDDDDFVQILEPPVISEPPNDADKRINSDQLPDLFGTIHNSSLKSTTPQVEKGNRDWALISIPADQWLPNRIHTRYMSTSQAKPSLSPPKDVSVLTGRGPQQGKLAANCSAVLIPPGEDFVNTFDFLPATASELQLGDSGSWVVNENTGEVLGHVVAVDVFGEAYVMPIHDTLQDIRSHTQAEHAALAHWATIELLRRQAQLTVHDANGSIQPQQTSTGPSSKGCGGSRSKHNPGGPATPIPCLMSQQPRPAISYRSRAPSFEWPDIFAHPRVVPHTETEDKTYLELIQNDSAIYEDSDEESSDDDSEVDSEDVGEGGVEGGGSRPPQLDVARRSEATISEWGVQEDEEPPHPVRLFIRPTIVGSGMGKQHFNEDIIYKFCEHAAEQTKDLDEKSDYIAIVDIQSNEKARTDEVGSLSGIAKPQRGGLTPRQLREELGVKEFPIPPSELEDKGDASNSPTVKADRVLISLPDMSEPGMRVLAECAPLRERDALVRFFYDHLQFTPSVDVALTIKGFSTYSFHLNVPFIAFRRHKRLRTDNRTKPEGAGCMHGRPEPTGKKKSGPQPLRRSWTAACLGTQCCFYEAQATVVLFGIDDRVYKVYGTSDNYYLPKSKYSVKAHHKEWEESDGSSMWDPILRRSRVIDQPIRESRHYFLSVWAEYLYQASQEWVFITTVMKDAVKQRRMETPETAKDVQDLNHWTEEMVRLLMQLIEPLSETTKVWEKFKQCDLGYFVSDDNKERMYLLQHLEKSYSLLRLNLDSLKDVRQGLIDTNRHEVQASLGSEIESVATKIFNLAAIAFFLSPILQVAGIFNMQNGVLPFEATTGSFVASLFVFIVIYFFVYLIVTWDPRRAFGARFMEAPVAWPATKPSKQTASPPLSVKLQDSVGTTDDIISGEPKSFHNHLVARIRSGNLVKDVECGLPR